MRNGKGEKEIDFAVGQLNPYHYLCLPYQHHVGSCHLQKPFHQGFRLVSSGGAGLRENVIFVFVVATKGNVRFLHDDGHDAQARLQWSGGSSLAVVTTSKAPSASAVGETSRWVLCFFSWVHSRPSACRGRFAPRFFRTPPRPSGCVKRRSGKAIIVLRRQGNGGHACTGCARPATGDLATSRSPSHHF